MRSERGPTLGDLVVTVAAILAALTLFILPRSPSRPAARVEVMRDLDAGGAVPGVIPLDRDGLYPVRGPLGTSTVEVRAGRVRMQSSPCPGRQCVRAGWKWQAGEVIVCAPNRIALRLEGPDRPLVDAVSR